MTENTEQKISVIITCYNQGSFLGKALDSVRQQNYTSVEIIVIDDGSTDNTRSVVADFGEAQYHYQKNRGLAAARNTGVKKASGAAICFLDADDWLLPGAIQTNVEMLRKHPEAAFVAGSHRMYLAVEDREINIVKPVPDDVYTELLRGNFIGMHACVLYRRWVFNSFQFNTALQCCEDYDLYLRITRKFPAVYHQQYVAVYNRHKDNMSNSAEMMLNGAVRLLRNQRSNIRNEKELDALAEGISFFTNYYAGQICDQLTHDKTLPEKTVDSKLELLRRISYGHYKWIAHELGGPVKAKPKPPLLQRAMHKLFGNKNAKAD